MRFSVSLYGLAGVLVLTASGCGNAEGTPAASSKASSASNRAVASTTAQPVSYGMSRTPVEDQHPEAVVREYLEAARSGDPTTVNRLLTTLARQKTQELDIALAPPVSETARFEVLGHEYVDADRTISHVASRWTETDSVGESQATSIVWVVRLEAQGWRIAGMIARISDDQPAMPFNFEDPEGIIRQQQSAADGLARHTE